jgi:hypothetical protein
MTLAGELITGVIDGFVAEGFKRAYREIRMAVRRRHFIGRALSGDEADSDVRLQKAIHDLQVVIGSGRGQLTEPVAAFIREIEKSALPESIVRCVLSNGDPNAIYPAFSVLHKAFSDTITFDSRNFFDALFVAVKLRIEQSVKDPALLEFVQAQNKEISRQIAEVARALRNSIELAPSLSAPEIWPAPGSVDGILS